MNFLDNSMNKNHYQNFDHVDSYYAATTNQSLSFRVLQESLRTQVCIIGGGFTGINTAINLAKKGYEVIVIDAAKVGWGASGRNGGQLISGFTFSDKFEKEMGEDIAQSVWELGAKSTDLVRNRIQEFDIQCDLKDGFIEVALNRIQMEEIINRKTEWEKRGYGHHLTFVDKKDIQSYVKSPNYIAGLIDSGSGHLHPLNLVLGEAKAAESLGVRIFEQTKAESIDYGKKIKVHTSEHQIEADYVVLAGNAYIDKLNKKLRRMIMPANSCIIATEPLSEDRARKIIPQDMAVCDLNTILDYYRFSSDHRMLFGGRWNYSGNEPKNIDQNLRKRMLKVFPDLNDVKIEYAWGGNVAVTINRIPQLGQLTENVFYSQGYSGHGVAPTHMAAEVIASGITQEWDMIHTLGSVKHMQLPGGKWFSGPAMALGMLYYQFQDYFANKS